MAGARGASRRRFVLLVIVLTAVTLITLDTRSGRTGPLGALGRGRTRSCRRSRARSTTSPGPVGDWWSGVIDSGDIKRENRKLRAAGRGAAGQRTAPRSRRSSENEALKKLLGLSSVC